MSRISIPRGRQTHVDALPLLATVESQLGVVPNVLRVIGHSPAALEGYLALSSALARGSLDAPLRERIALAVGELNGCGYCIAAHSYFAEKIVNLSHSEIHAARGAGSSDSRASSALSFARAVIMQRGRVGNGDLDDLRQAGFDEGETVEIILNVALNVLTSYVNNVAQTEVDFPAVPLMHAI